MAFDEDVLTGLAGRIIAAQDRGASLPPLAASFGLDLASAYAVADRLHRLRLARGATPVGRKIGFTNRNIWDEYGVHQPIWGWMYAHGVTRAAAAQARLGVGACAEPRIEPEIVFHFASAPPPGADVERLLACIDWIAHGFEIVQSNFPGWKFRVEDTVAAGGLHAALVLGDPVPIGRLGADPAAALARFELDLACDGERVETGCGANVLGNPLHALAHLSTVLAQHPGAAALAAGEIVTTGTLTAAYPIRAGQRWRTTIDGLPLSGLTLDLDR